MLQVLDQIWGALTGGIIQRQQLGIKVVTNSSLRRSGDRMQGEQSALVPLCGDGFTV